MTSLIHTLMEMERGTDRSEMFPHAPQGWTPRNAIHAARSEHIAINEDHWELIRALQEYFARHTEHKPNMRELHDALEERFHTSGGMKYLYQLFPGGPIAQGCRLAGLQAPSIAADRSFGSVM